MRRPTVAAICGLALLTAGCSSGHAASSRPAAKAHLPVVSKIVVPPGTAKGFVGARIDVSGLTCAGSSGTWAVAGNVQNPTKAAADYRIYTSLLSKAGETRGLLEVDVVTVAAGAKKAWQGRLRLPDNALHCVLRVERTASPHR